MISRYHLQRSIVYLMAVMIHPKAVVGMQMYTTDTASIARSPPPLPSPATLRALAVGGVQLGPMADKAPLSDCLDCRLHGGMRGGVGGGYLLQERLAIVQYLRLSAVLEVPQLVGVDDAVSSSHHASAGQERRPLLCTAW